MTDAPKSPKVRVTEAMKNRQRAERLRIDSERAYQLGDPLMGRVNLKYAAEADAAADAGLNHWNYAARPPQRGRGGELVPLLDNTPEGFGRRDYKVMTVEEPAHVLAHQASADAMDLLIDNDTLALGLEMADSVKAKNRTEKMLAHQMATLHSLGMRLAGKADKELRRIEEASVFKADAKRQAAIVETARLTNATARAMAAFNDAALTLQRLRTGGRQVVTVQHVTVKDGGQAVVAQTMRAGGKAGGRKRRGDTGKQ
jgi:hypothetical protein